MILSVIPHTQKRIGVDKWHQVLVELQYISISLPGSQILLSHMQESFCHVKCKWETLTNGVHKDLSYFRCLVQDLERLLTCLYTLVPLQTTLDGYYDASR